MEIKEGEIFEYNGEWYQCIVENGCENCAFNERKCYTIVDECGADRRKDNKNVIFKFLEKIGEPYTHYCPSGRIIYFQRYKIFNKLYSHNTEYIMCDFNENDVVSIEIKQTKEDMEEKKLNLKPFDLQKAKEGKPVCTRDGRKARIICFNRNWDMNIVALVSDPLGESVHYYLSNGKVDFYKQNDEDLMMLPEKKEGWINIYKGDDKRVAITSNAYATQEEALDKANEVLEATYITTNKIEWEE